MLKTLIKIRLKGILFKQTRSSQKKNASIGKIVLMALLFGYVGIVFIGMFGLLFSTLIEPLHLMGLDWLYFSLMSIIVIMFCFIGSIFLTHHEIYEAKDNELLLSMPIKNSDILLSRVFTILILNYVYEFIIVLPAFYVYITTIGMNVLQIIMFIIIIMTLPLFVLALSSFFSWILAHVLVHVKMKNIISLILYFLFMGVYIYSINYIEEYIGLLITHGESIARAIEKSVFPLYHLGIALVDGKIISLFIYLVFAIVPFALVIYLLSRNFIKLATTKPKMKKKAFASSHIKTSSLHSSLLKREIKHFTSNVMVMLNGAVGIVFCLIGAIAVILYADDLQSFLILFPEMNNYLTPILCLAGIGVCSMNIISASSISLEGQRLWILKTLPISTQDILLTKFYLHLLICIPSGIIFSLATLFVFHVTLIDALFVILAPILFTIFVDLLGLLMNLWKPKFDWINETVCVKQSMPVMLTMFISMGMVFVIAFIYIAWLSSYFSVRVYMYIFFLIFIFFNVMMYSLLIHWGVKRFEEL